MNVIAVYSIAALSFLIFVFYPVLQDIKVPKRKRYITVDGVRYLVGKVANWQNVYNLEHEVLDKPLGWHTETGTHHGIETKCERCLSWSAKEMRRIRKQAVQYSLAPPMEKAKHQAANDEVYQSWIEWTSDNPGKNPNQAPPIPTRSQRGKGQLGWG